MKQWTVFFFIHEVTEYENYVDALIDELLSAVIPENVNIAILFDKVTNNSNLRNPLLYTLGFSAESEKNEKILMKTFLDCDMSSAAGWKVILRFIRVNLAAQRYILFTWGHGSKFGIAKEGHHEEIEIHENIRSPFRSIKRTQLRDNYRALMTLTQQHSRHEFIRLHEHNDLPLHSLPKKVAPEFYDILRSQAHLGFIEREWFLATVDRKIPYDILWISELADAIRDSFGAQKLDYIFMMNCAMQVTDNGYELREFANVLIAPETNMKFDGYPYGAIIEKLGEGVIEEELFCKFVIEKYKEKFITVVRDGAGLVEETTVFCNRLELYNELVAELNGIAQITLDMLSADQVNLDPQDLRLHYIGEDFVDANYLFKHMNELRPQLELDMHIQRITVLTEQILIASFVGSEVQVDFPFGFSLFFPLAITPDVSISVLGQYAFKVYPSRFVNDCRWADLILKLIAEYQS